MQLLGLVLFAAATAAVHAWYDLLCPNSTSVGCPAGFDCCRQPWNLVCSDDQGCTVCADCCHSYLNATECAACVKASCAPDSVGAIGCVNASSPPGRGECCNAGVPYAQNTTLPNCLLIGDSVTNGLFPYAASALAGVCAVQHIENVDAGAESACWTVLNADSLGQPIKWDVIHFNEGLHSLWPRVNTSADLLAWQWTLANFTLQMKATQPSADFIYATMTPYPPGWFLNPPGPPRQDVETKNAAAVAAVRGVGVTRIDDLYSVITTACGPAVPYANCTLCDNESMYHPGYHGVRGCAYL